MKKRMLISMLLIIAAVSIVSGCSGSSGADTSKVSSAADASETSSTSDSSAPVDTVETEDSSEDYTDINVTIETYTRENKTGRTVNTVIIRMDSEDFSEGFFADAYKNVYTKLYQNEPADSLNTGYIIFTDSEQEGGYAFGCCMNKTYAETYVFLETNEYGEPEKTEYVGAYYKQYTVEDGDLVFYCDVSDFSEEDLEYVVGL